MINVNIVKEFGREKHPGYMIDLVRTSAFETHLQYTLYRSDTEFPIGNKLVAISEIKEWMVNKGNELIDNIIN